MASVMGICGGLVGPKSGNVGKALVLNALLKGVKRATRTPRKIITEWAGPFRGRKSEIFDVKCFVFIFRIVLPTQTGGTFSNNS